jgi:hypothetical protein
MVQYRKDAVLRLRAKETMVSTLRKYKKMENALYARVFTRIVAVFASFMAFLSRVKTAGRQNSR